MFPASRRRQGASSVHPQLGTKALIRHLQKKCTRTTKRSGSWFSPRAADDHSGCRRASAQRRPSRQLPYPKHFNSSTTLLFPLLPGTVCTTIFGSGKYLTATVKRNALLLFLVRVAYGPARVPARESPWVASWQKPNRTKFSANGLVFPPSGDDLYYYHGREYHRCDIEIRFRTGTILPARKMLSVWYFRV